MRPANRPLLVLALAALLAPCAAVHGADAAEGDAAALHVSVRAGAANALDSGALPSGASASAPGDYAITTEALDVGLVLGTLATVGSGPLRAGIRAVLGREHSEASAGASSVGVEIGGALGVSLVVDGAAATVLVGCRDGAPSVALDSTLEGAVVTILGVPIVASAGAAPNTVVPLPVPGARLVLNEQSVVEGVATVTALHLTLDDTLLGLVAPPVDAEVVVARATATLSSCGTFAMFANGFEG
ncbi:MAG TPA: hypothetical protein VND91_02255 [Candidatus Saccharimonadia bacterium]|nr:hypothetical protein [Candidatus Saccharimonadia bacterium]